MSDKISTVPLAFPFTRVDNGQDPKDYARDEMERLADFLIRHIVDLRNEIEVLKTQVTALEYDTFNKNRSATAVVSLGAVCSGTVS